MMFTTFISAALAASVASALPTLETRARSNCTQYTSNSAGSVCLDRPSDCTATYLVQPGDSCSTIAQHFGNFTVSVLWYWNPDVTRNCLSLQAYTPVCINTPWYQFTPPVQSPPGTIVEPANLGATAQPVPIIYGTSSSCSKYEIAGEGVYAYNMWVDNNITEDQFAMWNPAFNTSDPSTLAGYWYAVGC